MNRNQRRYGRVTPRKELNSTDNRTKGNKVDLAKKDAVEEILSPRIRRNPFKNDKAVTNRCSSPREVLNEKNIQQSTNTFVDDHFNNLIRQQYEFDPVFPDTINHLKELRRMLCVSTPKVENSSQYYTERGPILPPYIETPDGLWQNVESTGDIEKILRAEKEEDCATKVTDIKNIYINEIPHIKVIAEKFSKFTRNNVELRKLDEKIVCLEYDVFEDDGKKNSLPIQKMRAYFSVKPITTADKEETVTILPSSIKNQFYTNNDELGKLNEKEIEIIDAKITENKTYLDDLKRVLKKKQAIYAKKKKSTLDLKYLHEMAKREVPSLDEDFSNTNLLSKAELEEIKDLITKKCASSIHGISRRTVKCEKDDEPKRDDNINVISQSIFAELIRHDVGA